jgi:hypothetical protein
MTAALVRSGRTLTTWLPPCRLLRPPPQGAVVVTELAKNYSVFWDYAQYFYDQQVRSGTVVDERRGWRMY